MLSRVMTVFWGVVCVAFSFVVGDISKSVIESVNKIGSLANGPILALFLLGILTRRTNQPGAIVGLLAGFGVNVALWNMAPQVSWLWWNVIGFAGSYVTGYLVSLAFPAPTADKLEGLVYYKGIADDLPYKRNWPRNYAIMAAYTVAMIAVCLLIGKMS